MKSKQVITQLIQSDLQIDKKMQKTYELKLELTKNQISDILDSCLGEKIQNNGDDIEQFLHIAECIKSSNLSDEFCKFFTSELNTIVKDLVSSKSDSYEISNFQHRMLRKFSNCAPKENIA